MKLVASWKKSWRYYSNWAHAMQAGLLYAWLHLPADMKSGLTPTMLTGISIVTFMLGFTGSITSQDKNEEKDDA